MGKEQTNNAPVFDHANRMEDISGYDQNKHSLFLSCCLRAIAFVAFGAYSCAEA